MAAYLIADIDITDPAAFDEYRGQVPPPIAQYGGRRARKALRIKASRSRVIFVEGV